MLSQFLYLGSGLHLPQNITSKGQQCLIATYSLQSIVITDNIQGHKKIIILKDCLKREAYYLAKWIMLDPTVPFGTHTGSSVPVSNSEKLLDLVWTHWYS